MTEVLADVGPAAGTQRHPRWVRIAHWIVTASVLALAFTGFLILMVHPRLYWGEAGNDLTTPLVELPISRNYKHGGYAAATPFFENAAGPVSANRTYDIFNQNGWARSLHFLAGWCLVVPGAAYLLIGLFGGHFRSRIWPRSHELSPRVVWEDVADHWRWRIPRAAAARDYGVLQKLSYTLVVFAAVPLLVLTGLAMSPAVTAAVPLLLSVCGGYQSARTIHFVVFAALALFVFVHVVMVIASGLRHQIRAMTVGD